MFLINQDVGKVFGVDLVWSSDMADALKLWEYVSTGSPPWKNADDDIDTINMAKHIADTRAKLTTLGIGITLSGSARADFLQGIADDLLKRLPDRLAEADRLGGMIIKWNGTSWDFVLPGQFGVTAKDDNGDIVGAIFASNTTQGRGHYTRLEYHRFEDGVYIVTNKAFKNQVAGSTYSLGVQVPLTSVDAWADFQEEVRITGLEKPLFAYYRVPGANTIDPSSPYGLSVFSNAIPELRAIDVAISRKDAEVFDSKHVTFVGQAVIQNAQNKGLTLPRFVKGLGMGVNDADTTAIKEHVPTMLTDDRIKDINFSLSMAGVKCGFSEGVFVMDGQTGMITATQVESDDRDTIQTIKNDRDVLQDAVEQAMQGADALTTLLGMAPLGQYEINFNFGDITYNYEEDKASWKTYVMQGWVPAWMYFVKFEGMSEEDAKAMTQEAGQSSEKQLFGDA